MTAGDAVASSPRRPKYVADFTQHQEARLFIAEKTLQADKQYVRRNEICSIFIAQKHTRTHAWEHQVI